MTNDNQGFVMPDFGGSPASQAGTPAPRRKMALICSKGNLDMAYPGLILANAAAADGVEVHMFFTFWGLDIVNTKTNGKLKFSMVGNTAMHMPELDKVGMGTSSMPQFMGVLPGMTWAATTMMKKQISDLGVPDIPDFLDMLQGAGVNMYGCRMSFDMMKLSEADMHPGVKGIITAGDFIDISDQAQTIFI